MDPDAAGIAAMLSKINNREKTGVVLSWRPNWLKVGDAKPFTFYFHQDNFAVDSFNRDVEEMDALADDFTYEQRQEIALKTVLCNQHGVSYLAIGPDDELDPMTIAAKIGKVKFKKGSRSARPSQDDGIVEE